jgi:hypothetical protein
LRPQRRSHQGAGEQRRTQDRQSPLHTNFSFILRPFVPWRLCFAGRMFKTIAIAVPSKNPSQTAGSSRSWRFCLTQFV